MPSQKNLVNAGASVEERLIKDSTLRLLAETLYEGYCVGKLMPAPTQLGAFDSLPPEERIAWGFAAVHAMLKIRSNIDLQLWEPMGEYQ